MNINLTIKYLAAFILLLVALALLPLAAPAIFSAWFMAKHYWAVSVAMIGVALYIFQGRQLRNQMKDAAKLESSADYRRDELFWGYAMSTSFLIGVFGYKFKNSGIGEGYSEEFTVAMFGFFVFALVKTVLLVSLNQRAINKGKEPQS